MHTHPAPKHRYKHVCLTLPILLRDLVPDKARTRTSQRPGLQKLSTTRLHRAAC
jgi:hypothetical protein